MFGNEEENKNALPDAMRIALLTKTNTNPDLPLNIQERIIKLKNKKIEFILVDNVKDLFKNINFKKDDHIKGLIDKNWINIFSNFLPSVILLYYEVQIGINKEADEKAIYNILEEINNNYKHAIIFLIIVCKDIRENPFYLNFNDRQKPFYLKNFLTKDRLYFFPDEQIWKNFQFDEICKNIYNFSYQFYKLQHRNYKEERNRATTREEKIENDIKLGILSRIKTKKINFEFSKYFEEAYELLCDKNFDLKKYKYGSKPFNIRNNFYEIRATADWLFYKNNILLINNNNIQANTKNNNKNININQINEQIKKFEKHIKCFSNINYYEQGTKDHFLFIEYYWLSQRYKNLKKYIEESINKIKLNKHILMKWFMIVFKLIYTIMRMIKFYNKYFNADTFKLTEFKLNDNKIIDINNIEEKENNFYGKPPIYYYINKDQDNKIEIIGFNDEIYIKKFILKNEIKYDQIIDKFKNQNLPKINDFIFYFKNQILNNKGENFSGINIYLNLLRNIGINNPNIYEINSPEFYAKLNNDKNEMNIIKKFPKVHMDLKSQYINLIHKRLENDESADKNLYKKELFMNLLILGNMNKFTKEEECLFFELLNDENFIIDKQMIINLNYYTKNSKSIIHLNDLSLNFNYNIKDINKYESRKILDLIEYELQFRSSLSKGKIKLNSLQLFFQHSKDFNNKKNNEKSEIILKTFTKEELSNYELNVDSQINIPYKLFIKHKTGKISLKQIMFSFCKKENIIFVMNIPDEIEKTIFLKGEETDILKINYPNKVLLSGVNQLYKFSYSIQKKESEHIKIIEYKHSFSFEKADQNILKNEIFGGSKRKPSYKLEDVLSGLEKIIPPSIFYFDEAKGNIEEIKDSSNFEYIYDNFESRLIDGKNKFDILLRFYKNEIYLIKLNIKCTVLQEEVDEKLELEFNKQFTCKVINPLVLTNNISSNNYSLNNKENNNIEKKEFLTDTPIKMNLILSNEILEDIIIKDIQLLPKNEDIYNIKTSLKEILDSKDIEEEIKEEILKISKTVPYIIPLFLRFNQIYNDALGKLKLLWTTKSLKEFEINNNKSKEKLNFINETQFDLPNIPIKNMQIKYDYKYEIKNDNVIHLNIKIENKSMDNKKLIVKVGNNEDTSFVLSGLTNYIINLKNDEMKNIFLKLYIIQNGEIKLPDVLIKEIDYEGKEKGVNIFYSEKIIVN